MPAMANITVKKADDTTDVIYVAISPSAGDKVPAIWQVTASQPIQGFRPNFSVAASTNAAGTIRKFEMVHRFPVTYTDPATSLTKLNAFVEKRTTVHLPVGLTVTDWLEGYAQATNLEDAALIRSCISDGASPT
jgi:hypothetical protein